MIMTKEEIDRAIEEGNMLVGVGLDALFNYHLYENNKLLPYQIDRALEKGKGLDYLYIYQKLSPLQIDRALEKGEDLDRLYRYQKLSPAQIDRALEKGEDLDRLYSYQRISIKQIQYTIDNNISLEFLYSSPLTTPKQKEIILNKLGISVPPELLKSKLWSSVSPTKVIGALKQFQESVNQKVKQNPLSNLIGTYEIKTNEWQLIQNYLNKKQMFTKPGDYKYAYFADKKGRERQIKIGRTLKDQPDLRKAHSKILQLGMTESDLKIVISIEPEDIAAKSTGQKWSSCETIGESFGFGETCGWCDDIKANNLIAYIKKKTSDKWLGRCMIRWCIREDVNEPDAVIEKYHGDKRYSDMLKNKLIEILRSKGFSGIFGDTRCKTPYGYSGYIDSMDYAERVNGKVIYLVGDKPYINR